MTNILRLPVGTFDILLKENKTFIYSIESYIISSATWLIFLKRNSLKNTIIITVYLVYIFRNRKQIKQTDLTYILL